jgi:hypothetical protein
MARTRTVQVVVNLPRPDECEIGGIAAQSRFRANAADDNAIFAGLVIWDFAELRAVGVT